MPDALAVFMLWLHLSSMAALVGGILYARLVMARADAGLADRAAVLYRPVVVAAISCLIVSGVYNILSAPGHSVRYHVVLGIKLVLVAHFFATALLITRPHNSLRTRQMTGGVVTGLAIVAISAYLRHIF